VFSADQKRILSWSKDGTVRLWVSDTAETIMLFLHFGPVKTAAFDQKERRILTASGDSVQRWDIFFDETIPLEERILEFEVRSATIFSDEQVCVLKEADLEAKKQKLSRLRERRSPLPPSP
jgi:WD40 repeat protein